MQVGGKVDQWTTFPTVHAQNCAGVCHTMSPFASHARKQSQTVADKNGFTSSATAQARSLFVGVRFWFFGQFFRKC